LKKLNNRNKKLKRSEIMKKAAVALF